MLKRLLIFLFILLITSESMSLNRHFRRGQRPKCRSATKCEQWCDYLGEIGTIPRCYQHRCWCTTPESPMNRPSSYYDDTPEEPTESSGMFEFF